MLIPYLGEKSKFSSFIIPNIPESFKVYCEPFSGMFGTFFSLNLNEFPNVKFIYNDINYLNFNLFNHLKDDNFFYKISDIEVNREIYLNSINNLNGLNDLDLAINWLITLTCSSPYEIGKDSWRGGFRFEVFKDKYSYNEDKIKRIDSIENKDYNEVISKYDSVDTFFYLDPPYKGREKYYINHNFCEESHQELSVVLNSIKGKFLLSYYYFDGIENLYKGCKFKNMKTMMGTEYLIKNY